MAYSLEEMLNNHEQSKIDAENLKKEQERQKEIRNQIAKQKQELYSDFSYCKSYDAIKKGITMGLNPNEEIKYPSGSIQYYPPLKNVKDLEQAKLLLENGANPNYILPNGQTLISSRNFSGQEGIEYVNLLSQYGLSQETLDLSLQSEGSYSHIVNLVEKGANIQGINIIATSSSYDIANGDTPKYDYYDNEYFEVDEDRRGECVKILNYAIRKGYDFSKNPEYMDIPIVNKLIKEEISRQKQSGKVYNNPSR